MRERRGSAMYDPARDIFTSTEGPSRDSGSTISPKPRDPSTDKEKDVDEAQSSHTTVVTSSQHAQSQSDLASASPDSKKRKRSNSAQDQKASSPSADASSKKDANLSRPEHDPSRETSNQAALPPKESTAPKPMTAANLASISRMKKTQTPRSSDARETGSLSNRQRTRSPARDSAYSRRRDRSPVYGRRSPSPKPISRSPTPPARSPPRQRRRPGATARVSAVDTEAVRQRQREREQQQSSLAQAEAVARGVHDVVRQHYNAVPQRGREWRKTDSLIKGLRSVNNWIKSAIIQKFSPSETYIPGSQEHGQNRDNPNEKGLLVLDVGCGKGGDLQKWHAAPQKVDLYVGLDPAEISIDQARERYTSMRKGGNRNFRDRRPIFQGEFVVKDCYGQWIGDVPIVQEVGIDPAIGPDGRGPKRFGGGGFDVVTMMFCMHYAFESEAKARMMLRNVAGALKKGGRFVGVIPNSDILTAKVTEYNASRGIKPSTTTAPTMNTTNPNGSESDDDDDDWDPEKTLDAQATDITTANNDSNNTHNEQATDATNGETNDVPSSSSVADVDMLTWGNELYSIKFPHPSKLPHDGVFRPPFGWKYFYFLEEAVEEIPEYVVPWEAFRALAVEYDLELEYKKPFNEIWEAEKDDKELGPLSERMGVRERGGGRLLVSDGEMEAASFYIGFCFSKVGH